MTASSPVNERGQVAKLSKVRLSRLLQLSQQLLVWEPQIAEGGCELEPFRGVFGITGICVFDADTAELYSMGTSGSELEGRTRAAYAAGKDEDDPVTRVTIRRLGNRVTGAVAFQGLEDPRVTAEPLTSLATAVYYRTRLRRKAQETAAPAEVLEFPSTIFGPLGEELKNSLATILAATGGLREAGPLSATQVEMARMVEEEASRLGSVVSCLDRISRLDQQEARPRMTRTNLTALVAQTVEQYSQKSPDRQIVFASGSPDFKAFADAEFIGFALSQLLDKVCNCSVPGSTVRVKMEARGSAVEVSVSGDNDPIPAQERHRASERPAPRFVGGGLGFSVARKIAVAHGGTLDFDPRQTRSGSVAFLLSLPTDTKMKPSEL
jgi:two-component system, OmpR family, sensor histidine kinase KdpD